MKPVYLPIPAPTRISPQIYLGSYTRQLSQLLGESLSLSFPVSRRLSMYTYQFCKQISHAIKDSL